MNRSKTNRYAMPTPSSESESDDSMTNHKLAKKLKNFIESDNGIQTRRKNIFNDEIRPTKLRPSVVQRALKQHVFSSTPATKNSMKFFSSDISSTLSPISTEPNKENIQEENVIIISDSIAENSNTVPVGEEKDEIQRIHENDKNKTLFSNRNSNNKNKSTTSNITNKSPSRNLSAIKSGSFKNDPQRENVSTRSSRSRNNKSSLISKDLSAHSANKRKTRSNGNSLIKEKNGHDDFTGKRNGEIQQTSLKRTLSISTNAVDLEPKNRTPKKSVDNISPVSEPDLNADKKSKIPVPRTRSKSRDESRKMRRNSLRNRGKARKIDQELEESCNKPSELNNYENSLVVDANKNHVSAQECYNTDLIMNDINHNLSNKSVQKTNSLVLNTTGIISNKESVILENKEMKKSQTREAKQNVRCSISGYVSETGTEVTEKRNETHAETIFPHKNTETNLVNASTSPIMFGGTTSRLDSESKKKRLDSCIAKIITRKSSTSDSCSNMSKTLNNVKNRTSRTSKFNRRNVTEKFAPNLLERQTQTSFLPIQAPDKNGESINSGSNESNYTNFFEDCITGNIFDSVQQGSIVERFSSFYNYNVIENSENVPWRFEEERDSNDHNILKSVHEFLQKQRKSRYTGISLNEKSLISKSGPKKSLRGRQRKYTRIRRHSSNSTTCKDDTSGDEDTHERTPNKEKDLHSTMKDDASSEDEDVSGSEHAEASGEEHDSNEGTECLSASDKTIQPVINSSDEDEIDAVENRTAGHQCKSPIKNVTITERRNAESNDVDNDIGNQNINKWLMGVHSSLRKSNLSRSQGAESVQKYNMKETNLIASGKGDGMCKENGNIEETVQNALIQIEQAEEIPVIIENKQKTPVRVQSTNKNRRTLAVILDDVLITNKARNKSKSFSRRDLSSIKINFDGFEDLATPLDRADDVPADVVNKQTENNDEDVEEIPNIEVPKKKRKTGSPKKDLATLLDRADDVPVGVENTQSENNIEDVEEIPNIEVTKGKRKRGNPKKDLVTPLDLVDDVPADVENEQPENNNEDVEEIPNIKVPKKKGKLGRPKKFLGATTSTEPIHEESSATGNDRPVRNRRPPKRRGAVAIVIFENATREDKKDFGDCLYNSDSTSKARNKTVKDMPIARQKTTVKKTSVARNKNSQKSRTSSDNDEPRESSQVSLEKDEPRKTLQVSSNDVNKPSETSQGAPENNLLPDSAETPKAKITAKKRTKTRRTTTDDCTINTRSKSNIPEKTIEMHCQVSEMTENEHCASTGERAYDLETNLTVNNRNTDSHSVHELEMAENDHLLHSNCNQTEPTNCTTNDNFLRPGPSKCVSRDSGTGTLLKSSTDDFNLKNSMHNIHTGGPRRSKRAKSRKVLENLNSNRSDESIEGDRTSNRKSHLQAVVDEYVNVDSDDGSVRLKFVEKNAEFTTYKDSLRYSDALNHPAGSSFVYLLIPPAKMKCKHVCTRHNLYYTVFDGIGRVHVQDRVSTVGKMSRIIIPKGSSYSISNDSQTEDLILSCVRVPA